MRGQHPGMPQPQTRQQSGYDDMQIWQQQMMFKQLQELQRQQQVRQSGEELRQHTLMNQISAMTKQTVACPLPAVVNGMPLHDASNFTWPGEYVGNDLKAMNNPQMLLSGNLNSAQHAGYSMHDLSNGLPLSQGQAQALQQFGFVTQQHDQSLYGLPVTGARGWINQYSHLNGIPQPQDLSGAMPKGGANVSSPSPRSNQSMYHQQNSQYSHVASRQDFPEKRVSGQLPADNLKNSISTNFEQGNQLGRGLHVQEILAHQEPPYSQVNYLEKTSQVPTPSSVSLDPTEQKILFSSDDDSNWDAFGMNSNMVAGSYLQGNPFDGNSSYNSFPSFQGGSWSALMQSAVAEVSSNESGFKEEWSGLNLQKTDVPSENYSTTVDSAKMQTNWFQNSLQGPSSAALGPISPFENGNTGIRDHKKPTFLQSSAKFASDRDATAQDDSSGGSHQQSVQFSSPNVHNPLIQPRNLSSYLSDTKPGSKGDGWVSNYIQPSCLKAPFKVSEFSNPMQHGRMNDSLGTVTTEKIHGNGTWPVDSNRADSSLPNSVDGMETIKPRFNPAQMQVAVAKSGQNKALSIQGPSEHNFEHGKHMLLDSSQFSMGKISLGNDSLVLNKRPQCWDSNPDNSDKVSGDTHGREQPCGSQKELSNDSYISTHSHPDSSDSGGVARAGAESHSHGHSNKKIHDRVGQRGSIPQKFQYHPMGNLGFVTEYNDHTKKSISTMEQQQLSSGDSKNYQGYPQQHSSSTVDVDQVCTQDAERTVLGSSQANLSHEFQIPSFCDGAAVASSQNKRTGQRSRNMLELINKVDQSTVSDATKNYADQTLFPQRSEAGVSDGHISDPQHKSPPFQGFGLQLGPPFERSSISNNMMHLSPQAVTDNNVKPHFLDGKEKSGTWLNTPAPDQSLHHSGIQNSVGFDGQPTVSQKTSKETSESSTQSRYISSMPASQSYVQNQLQNHQNFGTNTVISNDQSSNLQSCVMTNSITEDRHRHLNNTQAGNIINESSQSSFTDLTSGVSPFRFASPQDIRSSSAISKSGAPNFSSNIRSSSQQMTESHVSSQPSSSQQAGFSGNFQLWSNFSAQRMSNNFLQKGMPSTLQSISPNSFRTPPWIPPKVDGQDHSKGPNISSTMSTCLVNSQNQSPNEERPGKENFMQQFPPAKMDFSSLVQESSGNKNSGGSLVIPSQSTVKVEQKDSSNDGQGSSSIHQKASQTPNHDTHSFLFRPSDAQNRDYSVLQQVRSLSALEGDQNNRLGKRLKGMDFNMESQGLMGKVPHNLKMVDGFHTGVRAPPADNELSAVVQCGSFPSNSRMLSFSSTVCEDQNASKIVQDHGKDLSCQDLGISKLGNSLSNAQPCSLTSPPLSLVKGSENSQVASTWAEQPEMYKDGHASPMADDNENLQQSAESEHYLNSNSSDWKNIDQSVLDHKLSAEVLEHDSVQRSKKRKSAELLPWHREISVGSHWLHSIRMAEVNWANATNRVIEKGEDESDISDDGSSVLRSKRRLILTTALMQQLLPAIPVAILTQPASTAYESVMYLIAKLGLGDSCSMVSSLANGIGTSSTVENMKVGKFKDFEKSGDQHFLKIIENLSGRAAKLEGDLLRIEKRASVLDVKVECQDLERFSIINRFAKFHGRSQTESAESSSTSETSRKTFPQRFVAAIKPGSPPESVVCLSL